MSEEHGFIPIFISRENFRAYSTAGSLKKIFCIDGKAPQSFISYRRYRGKPIKCHVNADGHRLYKVATVIAVARAAGLTITPPKTLEWKAKDLEIQIEQLERRKRYLEESVPLLESELKTLTFKKKNAHLLQTLNDELGFELLSEKEIVEWSKGNLPTSGIYFLVKNAEVVYVGQSTSVLSRIGTHILDPNKDFSAVSFISAPKESLDLLETIYIKILNPKLNNGSPISKDRITEFFQERYKGEAA